MNWFTSDTHFFHKNIIRYCNRPFLTPDGEPDQEAMNDGLIHRWNERVQPGDVVYHLGDFAFGNPSKWSPILAQLNGYKILVRGNHDLSPKKMQEVGFNEVYEHLYTSVDGYDLYLKHIPSTAWDTSPEASYHLCGHVHTEWKAKKTDTGGLIVNVGVDVHDWYPVSLQELLP